MTGIYLQDFEATAGNGNGGAGGPAWVQPIRRAAIERFAELGFPTAKDEDWRFTNIAPITQAQFEHAPAEVEGVTVSDLAPFLFELPNSSRLVFVNGHFAPKLSSLADPPGGAKVRNLAGALGGEVDAALLQRFLSRHARFDRNGFTALNTAFARDGAFVYVPSGATLGGPVQLLFVSDARAEHKVTHPRNLIVVERGAKAEVLESFLSLTDGTHFTNAVTEAVVHEGGSLEYLRIQRESEQAYHMGTTHIHQERESRVLSFSISLGGRITRHNLDLTLGGAGIESTLYGLYLGHGQQLVDNHTAILHAHPNCSTREVYKGILDGAAHAVFNGKVYVTPEAQKTDAKQTNRNLLLSDRARVDTKPQLEIFADDVKCTHGATVGRLDEMALFYLRSRGIPTTLARKVLTYAFAAEVLEEIPHSSVTRKLEALVMDRLDVRVEG